MSKPLEHVVVGISISGGDDLARYALTPADVNRVTIELCRRLIGLGAQVMLGHKWTPGGLMQAVTRFAQAYQVPTTEPLVHNYLAWPDRASLSAAERTALQTLVNIVEVPGGRHGDETNDRVKALTRMREQMTAANHARLFLAGGWTPKRDRAVAGVVEEAVLSAEAGKAMYLSGMMGGAAANLIHVIRGGETPPLLNGAEPSRIHLDYIKSLRKFSVDRLAAQSGLSVSDFNALFDSHNLDTIVQLATRGMRALADDGRLRPRRRKKTKK